MQFADRPLGRLGRIGCAHDFAVLEHGVFAFENLNDDGGGNHEIHQLAKKRTRLMDGVEGFRLFAGHTNALLGHDSKSGLFDQRIDRARQITLSRVGLDNRKGAFNRHDFFLEKR